MAEKKARVDSDQDSDSDSDYSCESPPCQKQLLTVETYVELHTHVRSMVEILEDVFESGRNRGKQEEYHKLIQIIINARAMRSTNFNHNSVVHA